MSAMFGALSSAPTPLNAEMATTREISERARRRTLYLIALEAQDGGAQWAFWIPRHDTSPWITEDRRTSSTKKVANKIGNIIMRRASEAGDDVTQGTTETTPSRKQSSMLGKIVHLVTDEMTDGRFEIIRNNRITPDTDMLSIYALGELDGKHLMDTDIVEGGDERQSTRSEDLVEFRESNTRDEFERLAKNVSLAEDSLSSSSNSLTWIRQVVGVLVENDLIPAEAAETVKGPLTT